MQSEMCRYSSSSEEIRIFPRRKCFEALHNNMTSNAFPPRTIYMSNFRTNENFQKDWKNQCSSTYIIGVHTAFTVGGETTAYARYALLCIDAHDIICLAILNWFVIQRLVKHTANWIPHQLAVAFSNVLGQYRTNRTLKTRSGNICRFFVPFLFYVNEIAEALFISLFEANSYYLNQNDQSDVASPHSTNV